MNNVIEEGKIDGLEYCKPMSEWVTIIPLERKEEQDADSKIIVPDFVKNRGDTSYALVIAAGKGRKDMYNILQPNHVSGGEYVIIDGNAPKLELNIKGVKHYMISSANIVGIMDDEEAKQILKTGDSKASSTDIIKDTPEPRHR